MKIESKLYGDVALLSLVGELDGRGHQQLDKALKDLIDTRIYKIIVDLSLVRFMGQQTISLLLSHMKELRANGGDIRFLTPQRALLLYLKQNRVMELFQIFSTRAEALESYKKSGTPELSGVKKNEEIVTDPLPIPFPENPDISSTAPLPEKDSSMKSRFETGEILYANSCMLATLIKLLESKGMLTSEEASELMDYERLSLKGVIE